MARSERDPERYGDHDWASGRSAAGTGRGWARADLQEREREWEAESGRTGITDEDRSANPGSEPHEPHETGRDFGRHDPRRVSTADLGRDRVRRDRREEDQGRNIDQDWGVSDRDWNEGLDWTRDRVEDRQRWREEGRRPEGWRGDTQYGGTDDTQREGRIVSGHERPGASRGEDRGGGQRPERDWSQRDWQEREQRMQAKDRGWRQADRGGAPGEGHFRSEEHRQHHDRGDHERGRREAARDWGNEGGYPREQPQRPFRDWHAEERNFGRGRESLDRAWRNDLRNEGRDWGAEGRNWTGGNQPGVHPRPARGELETREGARGREPGRRSEAPPPESGPREREWQRQDAMHHGSWPNEGARRGGARDSGDEYRDYGRQSRRLDYDDARGGHRTGLGSEAWFPGGEFGEATSPFQGQGRQSSHYGMNDDWGYPQFARSTGQEGWGRTGPPERGAERPQGRVVNRGPKGYQRSDARVCEDVCDRFMANPHIDAGDIEVEVQNCEVTLKGKVEDRRLKYLAEEIAESVAGVQDVHNHLRIGRKSELEMEPEGYRPLNGTSGEIANAPGTQTQSTQPQGTHTPGLQARKNKETSPKAET